MSDNPYQSPEQVADSPDAQRPGVPVALPDPAVHRICMRCRFWFAAEDVAAALPPVMGPLSGLRVFVASVTGDEAAQRFLCRRCFQTRRRNTALVWGTLAVMLGIAVLMAWLRAR